MRKREDFCGADLKQKKKKKKINQITYKIDCFTDGIGIDG